MRKFYLLPFILCVFGFSPLSAQPYTLVVTSAPYQDMQGGTPAITGVWDDPGYTLPLGFDFELFGESTNILYAIEDFVGGILSTNLDVNSLNMILPFVTDLIDRGYDAGTAMSPITYQTTGTAGSRVFTLEHQNAGFYSGEVDANNVRVDFINFQLRIYEGTGNIEVHIGPYDISNPGLDFEAPGPTIGLIEDFDAFSGEVNGEIWLLSGNALNPTIETSNVETFVTWPIPENTIYRFVNTITSTDDIIVSKEETYYFPNPSRDVITLKSALAVNIKSPVQVINGLGETIFVDDEPGTIDVSKLSPGIYNLTFETTEGRRMERISVLR